MYFSSSHISSLIPLSPVAVPPQSSFLNHPSSPLHPPVPPPFLPLPSSSPLLSLPSSPPPSTRSPPPLLLILSLQLNQFIHHLQPVTVNDQIFTNLVTGFTDCTCHPRADIEGCGALLGKSGEITELLVVCALCNEQHLEMFFRPYSFSPGHFICGTKAYLNMQLLKYFAICQLDEQVC